MDGDKFPVNHANLLAEIERREQADGMPLAAAAEKYEKAAPIPLLDESIEKLEKDRRKT